MACMAMVRVLNNRPPVIRVKEYGSKECVVYISVHDANYINMLKSYKKLLKEAHPDSRRGDDKEFKRVSKKFGTWKKQEKYWYAQFGLEPPKWGG